MIISSSIYDLMIKSALVFNIVYLLVNYRKYNLKFKDVIIAILIENLFIVIGGKFFTYLDEFPKYKISDIYTLWFTSYGNMIGAFVGLVIYSLIFKKDLTSLLTLGGVPLPCVYAIGKIGCFTAGCCYGINYNGFGKVIYTNSIHAPLNTGLFPIQLVEAIVFFLIFLIFYLITEKKQKQKKLQINDVLYLLITISIFKFSLDYLRAGREGIFLSFNQKVSLALFFFSIIMIIYNYLKKLKTIKTNK